MEDLSKLSRYDLAKMAVRGENASKRAARREAARRARENRRVQAGARAGRRVLVAAAVASLPAYILEKNPDIKYLDEEETIETEAVFSIGLAGIGIIHYILRPDAAGSEELLEAGIVAGSCYLNHRVREMAREDLLEDADMAAAA